VKLAALFPRSRRCPDEAQLAAYADRRSQDHDTELIESHLAGCDSCLDQVAFLARVRALPVPDVPPGLLARAKMIADSEARSIRLTWRWAAVPVAASLILAIAIGLRAPAPEPTHPSTNTSLALAGPPPAAGETASAHPPVRHEDRPVVRSKDSSQALLVVLTPRPEIRLARGSLEFQWRDVPDAIYYEVQVLTSDGDVAWQQRVEATSVSPEPGALILSGKRYYLQVRAYLREGKTVASDAIAFQVTE
jgi:hypothetical protein